MRGQPAAVGLWYAGLTAQIVATLLRTAFSTKEVAMSTRGSQEWWMATNGRWYPRSALPEVPADKTVPEGTVPPPRGEAGFRSHPGTMNTQARKISPSPPAHLNYGLARTINLVKTCELIVSGAIVVFSVVGILAVFGWIIAGPEQADFSFTSRRTSATSPAWNLRFLFAGASALAAASVIAPLVGLYGLLRGHADLLWYASRNKSDN